MSDSADISGRPGPARSGGGTAPGPSPALRIGRRTALELAALAALGGAAPVTVADGGDAGPALEVTTGAALSRGDGGFIVGVPEMRAVLRGEVGGDAVEPRFTYRGPTVERSRLASGQVREQLGLELRALDGCNLVYVMWRLAPRPGIVVSVKRNPGQRTHAECGARGYDDVRPSWSAVASLVKPESRHVLAARIDGADLQVLADDTPVWRGRLPEYARAMRGPVGVRSDNVAFEFSLKGDR